MTFAEIIKQKLNERLEKDEKFQELQDAKKECKEKIEELDKKYETALKSEFGKKYYCENDYAKKKFQKDYPAKKARLEEKIQHSLRKNHWKAVLKETEERFERLKSVDEIDKESEEEQQHIVRLNKEIGKREAYNVKAVVRENKENPIVEKVIMEAVRISANATDEKVLYHKYGKDDNTRIALNYIIETAEKVVVNSLYKKELEETKFKLGMKESLDKDDDEKEAE